MIALRVTPPIEEKGVELDGAEEVGGVANLDCLDLNCAFLRLTVAASMAHIKEKGLNVGKRTEKWRKILMIAEGKISLSRDVESLWTSMIERIK